MDDNIYNKALNEMIHRSELLKFISLHVTKLFDDHQTPVLVYHNLMHTLAVVNRTKEIGANYLLSDAELFILTTSAWFHDTGHLFGPAEGHEKISVNKMEGYMKIIGVEKEISDKISQNILATKMPSHPNSILAQILCDADLYHLGTADFFVTDELVKKEFQLRNNYLPADWNENTLRLLKTHQYFTEYCRNKLDDGKKRNVALVQELIDKKIFF